MDIEANQKQQTDEHLLNLVALQDVGAYEVLYDRYSMTIYSLLLRIVQGVRVAEDLLQDVFWLIWRDAVQFDNSVPARAWMFRIARNRGLDEISRRRVRPWPERQSGGEDAVDAVEDEQPSAESEAHARLNRQQILAALDDLPLEQRSCVELAYFEGLGHNEIMEQLQVPMGIAKSRLRIGMEKLERGLKRAGNP